ncbi:MAG: hypothetical protein ACE15C_01475 [Phycisphaerae bacterium]
MDQQQAFRRWPLAFLVAAVVVVVTPITGLIGSFASAYYRITLYIPYASHTATFDDPVSFEQALDDTGVRAGLCLGLLASSLWCIIMVPFAVRRERKARSTEGKLTWAGAAAGASVGVAATIILHWVLQSVIGQDVEVWCLAMFAIVLGLPAGAIVGTLFGIALQLAVKVAFKTSAMPEGPT